MKEMLLCAYDPSDPDSEPQAISKRYQPRTLRQAYRIIASYNRLTASDPAIVEVLGLFPKLGTNVLDTQPDVVAKGRRKVGVTKHSLKGHGTNLNGPAGRKGSS